MAKCPSCQTTLKEDFGLTTCSGCGAVCFVDLDDNASLQSEEMQNLESANQDEDNAEFNTDEPLQDLSTDELNGEASLEAYQEDSNLGAEEGVKDFENLEANEFSSSAEGEALDYNEQGYSDLTPEQNFFETAASEEELEDHTTEEQPIEEEVLEENLELGDNPLATEDPLEEDIEAEEPLFEEDLPSEPSMSAEDFKSEIELFGNLDSESFQSGAYFFDITISGIDSKDIREEILESLDNDKLKLEHESFPKKIRDGVLKLHQIPAVKAFIIIQTLSHLKCELDWELKELQDLENEPVLDESEYQEQEIGEEVQDEEDDFLGDLDSSGESEF